MYLNSSVYVMDENAKHVSKYSPCLTTNKMAYTKQ